MKYQLSESDDGRVTIINAETKMNILAIDSREVNGKVYDTPIFVSRAQAQIVLDTLNDDWEERND